MAGRKPKYTPERVAVILSALERGETCANAVKMAGINKDTFHEWYNNMPEFHKAVDEAKAAYEEWVMNGIKEDAKKSLKTLICGIEYDEIKKEFTVNKEGQKVLSKQTTTHKRIMPSITAIIFALCNRDPENWKNRVEGTLSGKIETESKQDVSLKSVPDDLLEKVIDAINGKLE